MTLTAAPASAAPTAPRRRPSAPPAVLGGEAWIVPFERGGYPWITASTPKIQLTDRRSAGPQGT